MLYYLVCRMMKLNFQRFRLFIQEQKIAKMTVKTIISTKMIQKNWNVLLMWIMGRNLFYLKLLCERIANELLMYFRAKKKTSREMSLYEPIGTDKEGNQIQLVDVIESEDADIVEQMEISRKTEKLTKIISKALDGRELFIIINRYGLFQKEPMTQREIAEKLGISRSYVSRIEKKALDKLKKSF